jgi:hypothetical protein
MLWKKLQKFGNNIEGLCGVYNRANVILRVTFKKKLIGSKIEQNEQLHLAVTCYLKLASSYVTFRRPPGDSQSPLQSLQSPGDLLEKNMFCRCGWVANPGEALNSRDGGWGQNKAKWGENKVVQCGRLLWEQSVACDCTKAGVCLSTECMPGLQSRLGCAPLQAPVHSPYV